MDKQTLETINWVKRAQPSPALGGNVKKARRMAAHYPVRNNSEFGKSHRWIALYWTRVANVMSGGYPVPR